MADTGKCSSSRTPLILSTATWSVQHFVDRMFLTWYSPETIAAAMPAGMLNFTIISIFMGTAGYVSTFVAQYYGGRALSSHRPGPLAGDLYIPVWWAFPAGALFPLAEPTFRLIGHSPQIQKHEVIYFQILCLGGGGLHRVLCTFRIFQRSEQNLAGNVGKRRDYGAKSYPGLRPDLRSLGVSGAGNQRSCLSHGGGRRVFIFGFFSPC